LYSAICWRSCALKAPCGALMRNRSPLAES
jgi:hypothetical protein